MLELDRLLPADRAQVFEAFTTADRLAQWWGPVGFTIPAIDFDPRLGGSYRIEMQPPEGDRFALVGEFREVEAPHHLALTFVWEQPDPDDVDMLAELTFEDRGDSTLLALRQHPFRTEARRQLHHDGWSETLDKLAAWLTAG
ncbi:MAG TPA: SRPBCC domain-containing protein [Thermoleophilaceae bacterium]